MSVDQHLRIDTTASQHVLRDILVAAKFGFDEADDLKGHKGAVLSGVISDATNVVIREGTPYELVDFFPGIVGRRSVSFYDQKAYLSRPEMELVYEQQSIRGVVALLKAFPEADAYWEHVQQPVLLRRGGHTVMSREYWHSWPYGMQHFLKLIDIPYVMGRLTASEASGKLRLTVETT